MALGGRIPAALDVLVSEAQRLGIFEKVNQHESKSQAGNGITMEIVYGTGPTPLPSKSSLSKTSARVIYFARIMIAIQSMPEDSIDAALTNALDLYFDSLHGELGLGDPDPGSFIDILGQTGGVLLDAQGGYLTLDQTLYRVATITIPVVMFDAWVQVM
jgi:hypothetical protein